VMRARRWAPVLALLPCACLVGRSKEARTFVLDPLAARQAASPTMAPTSVLGVTRVAVPGWIDRPQVTARGPAGEILTDDFSRWGEPIARGIQRVVAENLAALLPDRRVLALPAATPDAVDQRLEITLVEAARQTDGSVLVEARWDVIGPGGTLVLRRRSVHRAQDLAPGAAGAVAGASETLAALCREIAAALLALPPPERSEEAAVSGKP
jgi:uncharacterized lipoprotein YmbA